MGEPTPSCPLNALETGFECCPLLFDPRLLDDARAVPVSSEPFAHLLEHHETPVQRPIPGCHEGLKAVPKGPPSLSYLQHSPWSGAISRLQSLKPPSLPSLNPLS